MKQIAKIEGCIMSKYTVEEVAAWFLAHGNRDISPKKLQKLVYYAYAWVLTLLNEDRDHLDNKLFDDHFEAWVHGPVILLLYAEYADYGFGSIDEKPDVPVFTEDVENVLEQVWDIYGKYSANELESMTHQEDPWINARKGLSPLQKGKNTISDKDIFDYYIKQAG